MGNSKLRNALCSCGSQKKFKKCCMLKFKGPELSEIKRSIQYIEGMVKANRLAKKTLEHTAKWIKPGVSTKKLEQVAHDFMLENNARPATLNYHGFPSSICVSLNEVICHGIPSDRELLPSDILNIDVSCELGGYFGDTSASYALDEAPLEAKKLIEVTAECLKMGINAVKPYGFIGDIGAEIVKLAHQYGYSVVEKFVGHGIGKRFHEEPQVPHFGQRNTGVQILPGMIFTIEPMINLGDKEAKILKDGWTAVTIDGKLSAQFEHTILVTPKGVRVLSAEDSQLPLIASSDLLYYS